MATLSLRFVRLGVNMSKVFTDMPVEEIMSKLERGVARGGRGLHDLGIVMTEDKVKAEAMRLGMVARQGTDRGPKAQARISLITRESAKSFGQLGERSNTAGAQTAALWGRIDNLMEDMGKTMLPIVAKVMEGLNLGVQASRRLGAVRDRGAVGVVDGVDTAGSNWKDCRGSRKRFTGSPTPGTR